jgi:hypothetical protein
MGTGARSVRKASQTGKSATGVFTMLTSHNSPLSLMVTMTLFGNMASRVQGDVYFTGVHEIIALTNLPPFHHMQRPFIVKKHSAMGNTFPIVVGSRVSA